MTTFTESLVTPGAVAPPLFLPSVQGFTQNGPEPSSASDVRPFSLQVSCASAAFEPMPRPFGCGPIPGPVKSGGAAADACVAPSVPNTPTMARLTRPATNRRGREDLHAATPLSWPSRMRT